MQGIPYQQQLKPTGRTILYRVNEMKRENVGLYVKNVPHQILRYH